MLPWWHLATSLIVSYVVVASLNLDITTGISWIVVGCVFGTFIDLDHILYAFLFYGRGGQVFIKKEIAHPKKLIKEFQEKGTLHFHPYKRMILHIVTMFCIYLISLYFFPSYSLIIGLVFITHLILDMDFRWLKY